VIELALNSGVVTGVAVIVSLIVVVVLLTTGVVPRAVVPASNQSHASATEWIKSASWTRSSRERSAAPGQPRSSFALSSGTVTIGVLWKSVQAPPPD